MKIEKIKKDEYDMVITLSTEEHKEMVKQLMNIYDNVPGFYWSDYRILQKLKNSE